MFERFPHDRRLRDVASASLGGERASQSGRQFDGDSIHAWDRSSKCDKWQYDAWVGRAAERRRPVAARDFLMAWLRYLITRVALTMISGGTLIPSSFAVVKFTANSNTVGCSIGRSPGLLPLRIRST